MEPQEFSPTGHAISKTSQAAVHSLSPLVLAAQEQMVFDLFENEDVVLTRDEIARNTNLRLGSVCRVTNCLVTVKQALAIRGEIKDPATGHWKELIGLPVKDQRDFFGSRA
ncbi:MAG: hypothetical protein ACRYG5_09905 [Janthinobacterium lividum]